MRSLQCETITLMTTLDGRATLALTRIHLRFVPRSPPFIPRTTDTSIPTVQRIQIKFINIQRRKGKRDQINKYSQQTYFVPKSFSKLKLVAGFLRVANRWSSVFEFELIRTFGSRIKGIKFGFATERTASFFHFLAEEDVGTFLIPKAGVREMRRISESMGSRQSNEPLSHFCSLKGDSS